MEDHGPLVLKLGNNHVIFQILLLPMELSEVKTLVFFDEYGFDLHYYHVQ